MTWEAWCLWCRVWGLHVKNSGTVLCRLIIELRWIVSRLFGWRTILPSCSSRQIRNTCAGRWPTKDSKRAPWLVPAWGRGWLTGNPRESLDIVAHYRNGNTWNSRRNGILWPRAVDDIEDKQHRWKNTVFFLWLLIYLF